MLPLGPVPTTCPGGALPALLSTGRVWPGPWPHLALAGSGLCAGTVGAGTGPAWICGCSSFEAVSSRPWALCFPMSPCRNREAVPGGWGTSLPGSNLRGLRGQRDMCPTGTVPVAVGGVAAVSDKEAAAPRTGGCQPCIHKAKPLGYDAGILRGAEPSRGEGREGRRKEGRGQPGVSALLWD